MTTTLPPTTIPPTTAPPTTPPPTTPPPTTPPPTTPPPTTPPPTTPPPTTPPPTTPPPTTAPPTTPPPTTPPPTTPPPTTPPPTTPPPTTTLPPTTPPPPYVYVEPPRLTRQSSFSPSDFSDGTGIGYSVALKKDVPFDFQFEDRFGNAITNDFDLVNSFVDVSIGFDVLTTGDSFAPSGENFRSGIVSTNYLYTYEQNSGAFGSPQRYYKLKFKLQEDAKVNYNIFTIYHLPAEISNIRVSGYSEGQTGGVTLSVDTPSNGVNFLVRRFDVHSGDSSGFYPTSGNLIKSFPIYQTRNSYDLQIQKDEQIKGATCFYKVLPYDDFATGYFWTGTVSGSLDYPRDARTFLEAIPVRGSFEDRTGIFTGYATPALTEYDGISFYQTGVNQDLYVVKSGQWKTVSLV